MIIKNRKKEPARKSDKKNNKGLWVSGLVVLAAAGITLGYLSSRYKNNSCPDSGVTVNGRVPYEIYFKGDAEEIDLIKKDLETITGDNFENIVLINDAETRRFVRITSAKVFYDDITYHCDLLGGSQIEGVRELIPLVEDIISAGFDFWKHPNLSIPNYEFVFPKSVDELDKKRASFRRDKKVEIFPVDRSYRLFKGRVSYIPSNIWSTFEFGVPFRGEYVRKSKIDRLEGGGIGVTYSRFPIRWVQDSSLVSRMETPSIELLHLQMGVFTDDAIGERFKAACNGKGYNTIMDVAQEYGNIKEEYIYCEELFVHGLHRLFFEGYVRDQHGLGIDLENLGGEMGWDRPEVRVATQKIKKAGVLQSIDEYIKSPMWIKR